MFAGTVSDSRLISSLIMDNKPVPFISWPGQQYLTLSDKPFNTFPQNLIKSGKELYVFVNGSGRLYRISRKGDNINFVRVDSTSNFGYNIGSFGFSYKNHIYNLGGYGYWRMNGQLRVFNQRAQQWDIVKLNKEIPVLTGKTEGMLWYDILEGKIYTAYYIIRDEAIKTTNLDETQFVYDVMMLDLQKLEWTRLGSLSSFLKDKFQITKPITMSPWGQLISIGDKISLLDYKNNRIATLDVHKEQYQSLIREGWGSSFYFRDSTLFFGNNSILDSLEMRHTDFILINEPLYTEEENLSRFKKSTGYVFFAISLSLFGITAILIRNFRLKKEKNKKNLRQLSNINTSTQKIFDELEIQLLTLLIHNTSAGNPTSIEEQNKVLGLTRKTQEIQKKQRSDIILGINRKYSFITKSEDPIIKKNRTEFDKRSFEYFIDYSRLEEVIGLLNKI